MPVKASENTAVRCSNATAIKLTPKAPPKLRMKLTAPEPWLNSGPLRLRKAVTLMVGITKARPMRPTTSHNAKVQNGVSVWADVINSEEEAKAHNPPIISQWRGNQSARRPPTGISSIMVRPAGTINRPDRVGE